MCGTFVAPCTVSSPLSAWYSATMPRHSIGMPEWRPIVRLGFDHDLGVAHGRLGVAVAGLQQRADVRVAGEQRLGVGRGRRVEHSVERLDVAEHELGRVLRRRAVTRHHNRDRLPDEAHTVGCEHRLQVRLERVVIGQTRLDRRHGARGRR